MSTAQHRLFELRDYGLISFSGDDAQAFLHAQLTSDVAGLPALTTQYSGYCSPKGRLIATFLLWRLGDEFIMQLPASLRESTQTKLSRYVLRSKVKIADASSRFSVFGIAGDDAAAMLGAACGVAAPVEHRISSGERGILVTKVASDMYVVLAPTDATADLVERFGGTVVRAEANEWRTLEIAAGVPMIDERSQEQYVPQMVNLDLVGGVSFNKGCYPGQEIVARMHYLGRLKQRMYRIRVPGDGVVASGDSLYSVEFGPDQASGSILFAGMRGAGGTEALAVVQKAAASTGSVHYATLDGPAVEFLPLPYAIPD